VNAVNRLADETSPYLRQHADNPVDWYPWGPEAFDRASKEDRPVLLSVGYSACHWCHVMAHESFEDPEVAAVMNERFVNVKVDREERPDVDAIYMEATQAMSGSGGWPMTVFMTPDGQPFFCGTYFPKQSMQGRPGFVDLCRAVDEAWRTRRDELVTQAGRLTDHVRSSALQGAGGGDHAIPGAEVLTAAVTLLVEQHDDRWGGFGRAPKFPQTMSHELLLSAHARTGNPEAGRCLTTSLDAMAAGGIYDHLGGGFARYSVDPVWLVPHFEKMLYDQALLARLYLHAWLVTGRPGYRQVLDETIAYVLRDLRHPDGGFYSAEDADSEGEEGKFYLWTADEVRAVLGDDAAGALAWWGVTEEGNFEGRTILNRMHARGELERPPAIEDARRRLFAARERRVRPGLDDKVLTEWNGLMLATLAESAAATGNQEWLEAAVATGEFLAAHLRRDDGRWLRSWQAEGGARHLGFAADHAAIVDALCRLGEATGQARWTTMAAEAADVLIDRFWDEEDGGFFTTGDDGERLIARSKDLTDGASPGANSLAAVALLRLGALTGVGRYRERAEAVLALLGPVAGAHPTAFGHLLAAVDLVHTGITEVVVVGDAPDLVREVQSRFVPNAVLAWGEPYPSPLWEGRQPGHAYVCQDYTCQAPVTTPEALAAQLDAT
jgi:uncharacterized protein YyaL (SSP411 family)